MLFQTTSSTEAWLAHNKPAWSGAMAGALPDNVHLLSLQARYGSGRELVLRLMHVFELGEHPTLSLPASVDVQALFPSLNVTRLTEMTMSANLPLSELETQLLQWKRQGDEGIGESTGAEAPHAAVREDTVVTLAPMQIRTFLVNADPVV